MSTVQEYRDFHKGEDCTEEECRSKQYFIEDGKAFCRLRGHEQSGFTQTQQDEDDWNTRGKKTRKQREEQKKEERILKGRAATDLYLQCYQLILWKQCHWLVTIKGFPKELETIIRDLWTLRLVPLERSRQVGSEFGSTLGFSSMSEGDESEESGTTRSSSARRKMSEEKLPKLIDTLGLCYLGILLLKLPISMGELHGWALQGDLLYNRVVRELPVEMTARLPGQFHAAFELRSILKGIYIHRAVLRLAEFYNTHFEMVLPPLNAPLLIFKHIRNLGLPVEVYPAVQKMISILGIEFAYPIIQRRLKRRAVYLEVRLISLIVVATKLSHPFDDISRIPDSDSDPTTTRIDWDEWRRIMAEEPTEGLRRGDEIKVTDRDVVNLSGEKMDDYLDWYQRTYIDESDRKMAANILALFPLDPLQEKENKEQDVERITERVKEVHEHLVLQRPVPPGSEEEEEDIKRPGELYRRYRTIEDLPENARAFYEKAASNSGLELQTLVRGVFRIELQLDNWHLAERKRLLANGRMSISEDD